MLLVEFSRHWRTAFVER